MLCKKPFVKKGAQFGCGQCLPCRINRRRLWTHRIMLEASVHAKASFVTLTYSPENLPPGGTLVPRDLQLFLKRVRKRADVRFFGVGEYGDLSGRPHYHLALFGIAPEEHEVFVAPSWQAGFSYSGTLTCDSAQYIAGYVTKKMTSKDDVRLNGRHPEFARMSLRPGIGALAVPSIADACSTPAVGQSMSRSGDVPDVLRHGARIYPLGRYLRDKLRSRLGIEASDTGVKTFARSKKMQAMRAAYASREEEKPFAVIMEEKRLQKIRSLETRSKLYKKKESL